MENPIKLSQKPLADFYAMNECLTFVTIKNSSEFIPTRPQEKGCVAVYKSSGRVNVTAERYMNMMEVFKPDFFTVLADGETFKDCPKKRVERSSERSEAMLKECMKHWESSVALKKAFILGSVEGGFNVYERKRMIGNLKEHENVISGYFIDGVHRCGHDAAAVDVVALKDIVTYTNSLLPDDKVKMMLGAFLPHVTIELIMLGIDVLDTAFVNIVTNCNRAIVFNFNIDMPTKTFPELDLMESQYKDDFKPFVDNCECLACRKHTRGYTNHLLKTHELLGPMLLTIHNLHHYRKFFEAIREAIAKDKLPELLQLVTSQYLDTKLSYEPPQEDKAPKHIQHKEENLKNFV